MAVGNEELVVISGDTAQKVPEIPTFKNEQEFEDWWKITIHTVAPRTPDDLDTIAVIQADGTPLKRFPDIPSAQRWLNQLHLIKLHHGIDIRHKIPNHGVIFYPPN